MDTDMSKWNGLQKYNFVLFIVHLILAVVLLIYFQMIDKSEDIAGINLDLYNHILTLDESENMFEVISEKAKTISEAAVSNLIVSFFLVTAAFHLFYALNPNNLYLNAVRRGNNYFRWLEYMITATTMIIIIAILSGVKDVKNYFILATSAIAMIATGQWFETSSGTARWIPIIIGFVLLGGIFLTIFMAFNDRLQDAKNAGFEVPNWLWATVVVLFLFYASFGAVPVAQMFFGGNYIKYEYTYLTLSAASKTSLGLLVGYGFGQRQQSEIPS